MARGYPGKARKTKEGKRREGGRAVVVNAYSEKWLRQGFCWVYPKEVQSAPKGVSPGDRVRLESASGAGLGTGIWDEGWIAVRRFREDAGPVDKSLLKERIHAACALRERVVDPESTAWRIVNAANDGLPGIRIDRYGDFAVLSLDSPSLASLIGPVCEILGDLHYRGVFLAWRPDSRDDFDPKHAPLPAGLVWGEAPGGDVRVSERGIHCLVRPGAQKDVGLFLDMRENRRWLEPSWKGCRVLNLFAHTGFFSVVAASHGASEVVSVDLSSGCLDRARANFEANGIDASAHSFLAEDVRKTLDRLRRKEERFDRVILDPPSFSHGPQGTLSARKAYPNLVASCIRVLAEEGWLIAALNLGEVSPRDFHGLVRDGSRKAGRPLQLLYEGGQSPDFPALTTFPEGRYLKFGVWRLVPGL